MHYRWPILAHLIFLLLFINTATPAFFKVQGKQIVDSTGTPVLFRGIGLGGWLVPEGYMLHIPGYGSPSYIDSLIQDLIGSDNRDQFYELYQTHYVAEDDIDQIAQWGFNSIRIPFHYRLFYDEAIEQFKQDGFALVDQFLTWCKKNNLFVVLDMHCAPGGQNKDNISDSDGVEARLWTQKENQDLTIKIWKEIARRYADETQIIGYDLLNEPVLPTDSSNIILRNFYIQLTDTIRLVDLNHILFIEGNWYATDFSELTPPFDSNMVYSFHKYWSETTIASIRYLLDIRDQFNVPLWMGESGENSNVWYTQMVQLYEQNNIGWCWWTHKKIETITSPFSSPMTDEYDDIISYWRGEINRPTLDFARSALFGMAQNLHIDSCYYRPGVVKSLFDPDFSSQSKPYKQLSIPGVINAVEYDFGSQAVGYSDSDFRNVSGLGGSTWNQGWQLRNDGVDIEESNDPLGYPYHVGWISQNEWLKYTVEIEFTGIYQVDFRVASNSLDDGIIRLYLDNELVSPDLYISRTGGWRSWKTFTLDSVFLSAGNHQLYVSFPIGGFNLNRLEFSLSSTDIEKNYPVKTSNYKLQQNYPNPFNPTTYIEFTIPHTTVVKLDILDVSGQVIATMTNGRKNSGLHKISFNGSQLPSGIYFYRLLTDDFMELRKMVLLK